ncbi:hypothetical protein SMICM304S_07799 [Streptomyces microflavus]
MSQLPVTAGACAGTGARRPPPHAGAGPPCPSSRSPGGSPGGAATARWRPAPPSRPAGAARPRRRQSRRALSGSGSPLGVRSPRGGPCAPHRRCRPRRRCRSFAAILLHPTNQRIAASTGCGQAAHCTESYRRCGTCCHDRAAGEGVRAAHAGRACAPGKGRAPFRPPPSPHRRQRKYRFLRVRAPPRASRPPPAHAGRGSGRDATAPEERMKSGDSRTVGQTVTGQSIFGHSYEAPPPTHTRPRPRGGPFHAQSGRWASPPGPVRRPRGMERRYPPAH